MIPLTPNDIQITLIGISQSGNSNGMPPVPMPEISVVFKYAEDEDLCMDVRDAVHRAMDEGDKEELCQLVSEQFRKKNQFIQILTDKKWKITNFITMSFSGIDMNRPSII